MNVPTAPRQASKPATRQKLARLFRATGEVFTVAQAADALGVPHSDAAKQLARWAASGWLQRLRRGLYMPVPVESLTGSTVADDPWIVAATAFAPCYVGGWTAALHWGLTEQLFRTIVVYSTAPPRDRHPNLGGAEFWVLGINDARLFGLKTLWRDGTKVSVSDASRTLVDMLDSPHVGGGIRHVRDMFVAYLGSETVKTGDLLAYADRFGSGTVFKRLGFLTELVAPDRSDLIQACRDGITTGLSALDPDLECDRIVKRWNLRIPAGWVQRP